MMTTQRADHSSRWMPLQAAPTLTVLVTDAAIGLPEVADYLEGGHRIVVTGDDAMGMSLAEVALPGAERIWANLRRSSELFRLRSEMDRIGPCDRMVLGAHGGTLADGVTLMQTMLGLLPPMRRKGQGGILIALPEGEGHDAIAAFLKEIGPALSAGGIKVDLRVRAPVGMLRARR